MWFSSSNRSKDFDKKTWEAARAEVRQVFMSKWDPIGVRDTPGAADEYDNYINGVLRLLMENAGAERIAKYLKDIEVDRMGLTDLQRNPLLPEAVRAEAVEALLELREAQRRIS